MNDLHLFQFCLASPELDLGNPLENAKRMGKIYMDSQSKGDSLVLFPELSLCGASLGDLVFSEYLLQEISPAVRYLLDISQKAPGTALIFGLPWPAENGVYNAAMLILNGRILGVVPQTNPDSANKFRYPDFFAPVTNQHILDQEFPFGQQVFTLPWQDDKIRLAVEIGQDGRAALPTAIFLANSAADLILHLAAEPEMTGAREQRTAHYKALSKQVHTGFLYAGAGCGESSTNYAFGGQLFAMECGNLVFDEGVSYVSASRQASSWLDIDFIRREKSTVNPPAYFAGLGSYGAYQNDFTADHTLQLQGDLPQAHRPVSAYPFIPGQAQALATRVEDVIQIQSAGLARRIRQVRPQKLVLGLSGGLDSTLALLVTLRAAQMCGLTPEDVVTVTMPGFGTSQHTYQNANRLMTLLGVSQKEISIVPSVLQHFKDIDQDPERHDAAYENAQARERTQILMDLANQMSGLVVGTGDLSELALGWCTYNGDHMSMYSVNAGVPKTLIRPILRAESQKYHTEKDGELAQVLASIAETPVSPELLPPNPDGKIAQKTEDIVGPYILHDFFLYHFLRRGSAPAKIYWLAKQAFTDNPDPDTNFAPEVILTWLEKFGRRFFTQQFKRSCSPDGPQIGSVCLSPRGAWDMPSDLSAGLWQKQMDELKQAPDTF